MYSLKHIFLYFSLFRSCSFQSLSFLVFYFPCLLLSIFLLCVSLHILYFYFLLQYLCVSSTFFHAAFYLSPLTFFVYHLLFLSTSTSFFVFYYPSWLSSTFFLCLYCVMFPLLFSLSLCMCFIIIIIIELLIYIELIIYIIINTQKNYTGKYF